MPSINWIPYNSSEKIEKLDIKPIRISRPSIQRRRLKEVNSGVNTTKGVWLSESLTSPTTKQGKGVVRPDLQFVEHFLKGEQKNINDWKLYIKAYKQIPLVTSAIDVKIDNAIQTFHITDGKDELKEILKKLIARFNLTEFFYNAAKQMLIYGNSFVEIVKDDEGIVDLKILDPLMMFVNRNEYGNFVEGQEDAYLQYLPHDPMKPIKFREDEIVHFKWNPLGESAYGNSIIGPLLTILGIKTNTEENLAIIIDRYAAPLIHFKVGTPDRPATQGEIDAMSTDLENIQADSELVTDDRVDSNVIGVEGEAMNLGPPLSYIDNQVIAGLQTPMVLLGRGDVDRAAAEVQQDMFDRQSKILQRVVKRTVEIQIFLVEIELKHGEIDMEDLPQLSWGEPQQRLTNEEIQLIIDLKNSSVITPQKANDLLPEEYQETLPEVDPMANQFNNPNNPSNNKGNGDAKQKVSPTSPKLERVQTARDKRIPDKQRRA